MLEELGIKDLGRLKAMSAAEMLYLTKGKEVDYKTLFSVTVSDLHLKEVLLLEPRNSKGGKYVPGLNTTYVRLGKNFKNYDEKPHENYFIKLFSEDPDIEYTMDQYVHSIRVSIGKARKFTKKIAYESDALKPLLRRSWKRIFSSGATWTHEGEEEKALQKANLSVLNEKLPDLIKKEPFKARGVLSQIGGLVCLLENVEYRLLKLLAAGYFDKVAVLPPGTNGPWGANLPERHFDPLMHGFENYIESGFAIPLNMGTVGFCGTGTNLGSGCSSCSGCSGCGGCGGD